MVELRHLTYFQKVAELRSFSKAAVALHTTQPSLSRQVGALERELGCLLFTRTARGAQLTPEGAALARHLEVVFEQLLRIPEVVRVAEEGKELVRVGMPQGLPRHWALRALRAVEARVPQVRLSLHEATTEDQRHQLQRGLLDLGIIHMDAPELHCAHVLTQRMGLASPSGSGLTGRDTVALAELGGWRIMAHSVGEVDVESERLPETAARLGVDIHWVFRRFSEHSGLIAKTAGVDAVLTTQASAELHLADWDWIPMTTEIDGEDVELSTWVAWTGSLPHAVAAVVEVLVDHAETLRPHS